MTGSACDYVKRYLDRFLDGGARAVIDLEQVSDHAGSCPLCYNRLANFFRAVELPESAYLRETIDELALSLYNLGKAIIRDRPAKSEDEVTDNVRITEPGGGTAESNAVSGSEMIDDAEDYTGSNKVGNIDLEDIRAQLSEVASSRTMKIDLALGLFRKLTALKSRYTAKAWNWVGVLHLQKRDLDGAEAAFLQALASPDGAREVRAFAHCNLGYVYKHRGDLDRAVRSAQRSSAFAEEDGDDSYYGRFAELYFRLLRGNDGDRADVVSVLDHILQQPGRATFLADLRLDSNRPVIEVFRKSALAKDFPDL